MFQMSNNVYDKLKWLVQIVLPAFSAMYFALADIWDLPDAQKVIGSVAVVAAFIGASLGISTKQYNKSDAAYDGNLTMSTQENGKQVCSLELTTGLEDLLNKDRVVFKVGSLDGEI